MSARRQPWVAFATTLVLIAGATLGVTLQLGYAAFQDLGEWIYHSATLNSLWQGQAPANGASFFNHPVPNTIPQLLLGLVTLVLGMTWGPVVYLLLYALAAALAVEALVRKYGLSPLPSATFLAVTTVVGTGFWNGFIAAQWGLVLLIAYWSLSRTAATSWAALIGFSLLAFFTHGLTFACWGVMALGRAIDMRRFWRLAASTIPSLAMATWYFVSSNEGTVGGLFRLDGGLVSHVFYKGYTASKMGGYQNLVVRNAGDIEISPLLYWGGVATNVAFVASIVILFVLILMSSSRRTALLSERGTALTITILLLVTLLAPPYLVGVVNPGERTLAVLAIVLTPVLMSKASGATVLLRRAAAGFALLGLLFTAVSLATATHKTKLGDRPSEIVIGFEDRETTLFAHRLDQFEDRVKAAEQGDLSAPLAFRTSVLDNP